MTFPTRLSIGILPSRTHLQDLLLIPPGERYHIVGGENLIRLQWISPVIGIVTSNLNSSYVIVT